MKQGRVFLIQCNGKVANHYYHNFPDRTYADEVNKFLYYRNDTWNTTDKRDKDFGEVKPKDIVIQYCSSTVKNSPSQIKNIYNVLSIENIKEDKTHPHIFRLELYRSLNRGCSYSSVQRLVTNSVLSAKMKNCGQRGFNICKVKMEDLQALLSEGQ